MSEMIARVADALEVAARTGRPIPPIRNQLADENLETAYAVQRVNTERHVAAGA